MLDQGAVEAIQKGIKPEFFPLGDVTYVIDAKGNKHTLHVDWNKPYPILVRNLSGLVDYCNNNPDNVTKEDSIIHVNGQNRINLNSKLINGHWRKEFLKAECVDGKTKELDAPLDAFRATFAVSFQQGKGDYDFVLSAIKNVKSVKESSDKDNGLTQEVSSVSGIETTEKTTKPIIELYPLDSFPEIELPPVQYLFRLREKDGVFYTQLKMIDDPRREAEIIQRIKKYLSEKLPNWMIF